MLKIFLALKNGFGNKIYNLIILHYLRVTLNAEIYTKIKVSKHDKLNEEEIYEKIKYIFPNIFDNVTVFDTWKDVDKIFGRNKLDIDIVVKQKNGNFVLKNFYHYYEEIIKMVIKINNKKLFKINDNLINDKYKNIIHIRYGDKLKFYTDTYSIFKPELYIKLIDKILKNTKENIYILTDSNNIVDKFIIKKINNKRIKLLNTDVYDAFIIMYNSKKFIFGNSTLAILAAVLNNNRKNNLLLIGTYETFPPKYFNKLNWSSMKVKEKYLINESNKNKYLYFKN